jgi:hypothetical protein
MWTRAATNFANIADGSLHAPRCGDSGSGDDLAGDVAAGRDLSRANEGRALRSLPPHHARVVVLTTSPDEDLRRSADTRGCRDAGGGRAFLV